MSNPFRALPSVHDVLQAPAVQALATDHAPERIADAVRLELS